MGGLKQVHELLQRRLLQMELKIGKVAGHKSLQTKLKGMYCLAANFQLLAYVSALMHSLFCTKVSRIARLLRRRTSTVAIGIHLSINAQTFSKSRSSKPRDVRAGDPKRNPLGRRADLSPGHAFLLQAMPIASSTLSDRLPSVPCKNMRK